MHLENGDTCVGHKLSVQPVVNAGICKTLKLTNHTHTSWRSVVKFIPEVFLKHKDDTK